MFPVHLGGYKDHMGIQEDIEKGKGQMKETVGEKIRNPDLQAEGKNDQDSAKVKEGLQNVADKMSSGVDKIKDKLNKND